MLPTESEIYQHYLHLKVVKESSGEWLSNVPLSTKIKYMTEDVKEIWNKTSIPHQLEGRKGEKKVSALIKKVKKLSKVTVQKRGLEFGASLSHLFDVDKCKCNDKCSCKLENQVPSKRKIFLEDQRGERKLQELPSARTLSLRGAAVQLKDATMQSGKETPKEEINLEYSRKKQKMEDENKIQSKMEDSEDSQLDSEDEPMSVVSSDEEWQDEERDENKKKKSRT